MAHLGNNLIRKGIKELQLRLPPGWKLSKVVAATPPVDAVTRVTAPNGTTGSIALEAKSRLDPKGAIVLSEIIGSVPRGMTLLVIARHLSSATRERLRERGIGYLDLTGNVHLILPKPGLFIDAQGATQDPDRRERPARSLTGEKAGRIVRALVDAKQPPGVRELAVKTGTNAGYVSRVLSFLDAEALITRGDRSRVEKVDWPGLLRRWAQESPLDSRGHSSTYLEPRSLSAFVQRLAKSNEKYAITGGLAAAAFAPVASPRLAMVWVRDANEIAKSLGIRPTQAGANVMLLEPHDDTVLVGTQKRAGIQYAAPSQVFADLFTSPGRGPSEAEELLHWMRANERLWRK